MSAGKRPPQVAKVSPQRRLIELGKDVLIVALTCSAVFLASRTPMVSQLRELINPPVSSAEVQTRRAEESVLPYGVAVRSSMGLYGVSYDQSGVERVFSQLSPLLGEALSTAGETSPATDRQWRQLLEEPGIYCVFQGEPPLSALSAWLGEGKELAGNVQALALGWDGESVRLGWREAGGCFLASTQVDYERHMDTVLKEFNPNGAAFAYTLAEDDATYGSLDPYVLVAMTGQRPGTYAASSPDFVGDSAALGQLLGALGFRSGAGSAYEAAGELAINESGDRLRVNAAGRVVFHAGEEERYPVSAAGERCTAQEAALAAWGVLDRAAGPWKGEASYVLTGVSETTQGWVVTYHARLGGIPVNTAQEGWCAQFIVEGRKISDFTICLRSYAPTGGTSLVTTERLAAAALRSQSGSGGKLKLCYNDNRSGTVFAGWIAEE